MIARGRILFIIVCTCMLVSGYVIIVCLRKSSQKLISLDTNLHEIMIYIIDSMHFDFRLLVFGINVLDLVCDKPICEFESNR